MSEDLISKQAVEEIINDIRDCISVEGYWAILERLKKLPSVTPMQRWIPVSEMLPEERKAVLVYAPEYNNIYCAYLEGNTWFIFGGCGSYAVANVVAWMPLPEPYKAESDPQESEGKDGNM